MRQGKPSVATSDMGQSMGTTVAISFCVGQGPDTDTIEGNQDDTLNACTRLAHRSVPDCHCAMICRALLVPMRVAPARRY
jgi:hypothetical protein